MVVAAPKSCPYSTDHAKRPPVEPYLGQRRPYHGSDEDKVLAVLGAKKLRGATKLADRDPVMTKAFRRLGIANALQREDHGIKTARLGAFGDGEWHGAASGNQADR